MKKDKNNSITFGGVTAYHHKYQRKKAMQNGIFDHQPSIQQSNNNSFKQDVEEKGKIIT